MSETINFLVKQGEIIGEASGGGGDTSALANKTDLTAIILTGTTNTSGNVISAGTWFYLNGTPCIAKVDIASGATFTEGTNYEEKTIGSALSELNSKINYYSRIDLGPYSSINSDYQVLIDAINQYPNQMKIVTWTHPTAGYTVTRVVITSIVTGSFSGGLVLDGVSLFYLFYSASTTHWYKEMIVNGNVDK